MSETPTETGWIGARRCVGCGRFLRRQSRYRNQCGDCWGPEDEFPGEAVALAAEMDDPRLYRSRKDAA
jgi:hypothetical protein